MSSRRTVLGTLSIATLSVLAGCSWLNRATGYVQVKSIEVAYRENNQRYAESVITVSLSDPPGAESPQLNYVHDDWKDWFDTPHTPVVSDALHEDLQREYEEVQYVVGVCSPSWSDNEYPVGCHNANASRTDFNRVQVHDRVTASYDTPHIFIHEVDGSWSFDGT